MTTLTRDLGQRMQSALEMAAKLTDEIAPDLMAAKLQAAEGRTTVRVLQYADDPTEVLGVVYAPGGLLNDDWDTCISAANALWREAQQAGEDGEPQRLSADVRRVLESGIGIAGLVQLVATRRGHPVAIVSRDAWRVARTA